VGGWAYLWQRHPEAYNKARVYGQQNKFTILCLGDSFTEGAGTDRNNSYPKQLEKILLKNITGVDINIINGARGGNSSSLLLKYLPGELLRYSPDIVIVMIGCNNVWNFQDSSYFIINKKSGYSIKSLDSLLTNLRTYKMLKIAYLNIKAFFSSGLKKSHKDYNEFYEFAEAVDSMNVDKRSKALTKSAVASGQNGNFDLALNQLKGALIIDKNNYIAYICIGNLWVTKKEFELARAARLQAIHRIHEWNQFLVTSMIAQIDRETETELVNKKEVLEELAVIKKAVGASRKTNAGDKAIALIEAKINSIKDGSVVQEIIEYDLSQAVRIVRNSGSEIILETYPSQSFINIFREISGRFNIPLVDNYAVFKNEQLSQDLFVPDGHCNAKGYGIIAENTYKTLIKYNLLPDSR
jgi:lysophospholipase L1-like esterase